MNRFVFIHLRLAINADLTITGEKLLELIKTHSMCDKNWLDLPESKVHKIEINCDSFLRRSFLQRSEAYLDFYATHHPCPSWKHIARSLRRIHLFRQAVEVESTYVQGTCTMYKHACHSVPGERLNITHTFGTHGRLPGIKVP